MDAKETNVCNILHFIYIFCMRCTRARASPCDCAFACVPSNVINVCYFCIFCCSCFIFNPFFFFDDAFNSFESVLIFAESWNAIHWFLFYRFCFYLWLCHSLLCNLIFSSFEQVWIRLVWLARILVLYNELDVICSSFFP